MGTTPAIFVSGCQTILDNATTSVNEAEIIANARDKWPAPPNKLEGIPLLLIRRYLTRSTTALDVKGEQLVGRYGRDWPKIDHFFLMFWAYAIIPRFV